MKISELKQIIESAVSEEVKKTIMEQVEEGKMEKYHIKCEGVPLATFETEQEAHDALPDYKEKHPGKELIIEKGVYESHDDMMDKLDEMNDQLEETENMENTEKQPMEGNEFTGALKAAKDAGEKTFTVDGKEYDVEECWSKQMEESSEMKEEEECDECGSEMKEEKKMCEKCGKEICECGTMMNESKKKKTLRLTESELTKLIVKMVNESVPGLKAYEDAHKKSGTENKSNLSNVDQKIKKSMSMEGNDNPEFPKQIGKGEKVARKNSKEQDEEVAKNFAGLQNLDYDIEPSEQFKKRLKMAIEGDKLMGNSSKDVANVVNGKAVEVLEKQVEDRKKDKEERVLYKKEALPVKHMNESKVGFSTVLNEEIEKMKKISAYNKKTQ